MYKRRIKAFLAIIALILLGLLARLFYLQIIKGDEYLADAEQYLRRPKLLPARRGGILDRKGRILAFDDPCHDLSLDYRFMTARQEWFSAAGRVEALKDPASRPAAKWIAAQQRLIQRRNGCSPQEAELIFHQQWLGAWQLAQQVAEANGEDLQEAASRQVRRIARMSRNGQKNIRELYESHPVVRGLDRPQAVAIMGQLDQVVGVELRASFMRRYPRRDAACHVIGLTGQVNAKEVQRYDRASGQDWLDWQRDSYLGGDVIGKNGVERMAEKILRGRRGFQVHRAGRKDEIVALADAQAGDDVHLTIDIELQEALAEAFRQYADSKGLLYGTGAIVVLDVTGGDVLALVSIPTFDLNTYRKEFDTLRDQKVLLPLWHRAVAQCYAPGSTIKPAAALSALASNRLTIETTFDCTGARFALSKSGKPRCWIAKYNSSHGQTGLVGAIRVSCNHYFAYVGQLMGPRRLCQWYRLFGLGSRPGTGLGEEASGRVPTDEWLLASAERRRLMIGDAWNMAIGQGPLTASPLQMANVMATIARGGKYLSPAIALEGGPDRIRNYLPIPDQYIRAVHKGMRDVVHHPGGTANKHLVAAGLGELGFEFCGKTGTAQVPPQKIDEDGDGKRDTEVRQGDAVWFAGFAPYDQPRIAFAVLIEYVVGGASANAAPLGLEVVRICRDFGYVLPD